jgi:hypothetical protein
MANAAPGRWHILAMDLGDLSDFRALDHLPALLAACRVWSPDCELARLDLDHVRADGQLDMVGDDQADADYRFFSVSRQKANVELAQVTEELPPTGYRVWIQEGEVKAMLDTRSVALEPSRGTTAWQPLTSAGACDQGALVLAVRADESVPKRPFYSMRLDWRTPYSGYSAWLWDLDPGDMVWPDSCESWSIDAARRRAP